MKFGICLPNNWGVEDVRSIFTLATSAEELGFDSVWVSEHVFNVDYVYERIGSRPYYDPLAVLSYVAAITNKVSLGTSVLVLPYHNPIRLAKTAATLDAMSGGRLLLGVGVGLIRQELEAMGCPFSERGAVTDETIAIMKELWGREDPSYDGRYHRFSGMKFSPKPIQKPHVPLLIGGVSRSAIRRAVRTGDGWHPTSQAPGDLAAGIRYLREQARAAGREASDLPVSVRLNLASLGTVRAAGDRYSLGPDPEEIIRDASAYRDLGVVELVISPATGDPERIGTAMEILARDVIPLFR